MTLLFLKEKLKSFTILFSSLHGNFQVTAKLGRGALGPPALHLAVEALKRGRGAALIFRFQKFFCIFFSQGESRGDR